MAELTPMMQQYLQIKEQMPDCILFFRLGDFYEMFADDALTASQELDLTLTSRDRSKEKKEDRTPMCGVPYHSSETYIARLVAKGYKVAICEQLEDPATAKGLVKRGITRIVTPGALTEASMLEERKNNYFASVWAGDGQWGLAFCDISTGAFYATGAQGERAESDIINELGRFAPAELLRGGESRTAPMLTETLQTRLHCCVDEADEALFTLEDCLAVLRAQFGAAQAEQLESSPAVCRAAGALLRQLHEQQKTDLPHVRALTYYLSGHFMELDLATRRNLELTETMRGKEKRGSLLWVLDKTRTAMGGRLLRAWLERPLLRPADICRRLDAVQALLGAHIGREELQLQLREVSDLERSEARIVTGTANCRDLLALAVGCAPLPELKSRLEEFEAPMLCELRDQLDPLDELRERLLRAIVDEPPFTVREGGMIRPGYSEELDRLRDIMSGGKQTLAGIETQEKEKTGIKNLRVGYNRVFGYYIEVSKGQTGLVPSDWVRKQTLTNCERYITPELKSLEDTILGAKERSVALEYSLFTELRQYAAGLSARILSTSQAVAGVDVLCAFAQIAEEYDYCRPEVDLSGELRIEAGRHPVVERMRRDALFVPNDASLGCDGCQVAIITGPNMAGKSTYMRQVALCVLMAQIGCFVPARSARIGIVDRVFTRIGASDDLAAGQSTFMVEMTEVADILKSATARSLLIFDEIGRGTSTFDGMAIARAVVEYTADRKRLGAKTLFATHYHELTVLEGLLPGVKNFNIAVKKRQDTMIFLRKIIPGGADRSYGVEVARMAGLPERVVTRARELLRELESGSAKQEAPAQAAPDGQLSMLDMAGARISQRLAAINVETLTPIEAMNILFELKQML